MWEFVSCAPKGRENACQPHASGFWLENQGAFYDEQRYIWKHESLWFDVLLNKGIINGKPRVLKISGFSTDLRDSVAWNAERTPGVVEEQSDFDDLEEPMFGNAKRTPGVVEEQSDFDDLEEPMFGNAERTPRVVENSFSVGFEEPVARNVERMLPSEAEILWEIKRAEAKIIQIKADLERYDEQIQELDELISPMRLEYGRQWFNRWEYRSDKESRKWQQIREKYLKLKTARQDKAQQLKKWSARIETSRQILPLAESTSVLETRHRDEDVSERELLLQKLAEDEAVIAKVKAQKDVMWDRRGDLRTRRDLGTTKEGKEMNATIANARVRQSKVRKKLEKYGYPAVDLRKNTPKVRRSLIDRG